ncbi:MAG: alcohol dehydrogenase catalytic domain-containing protein [Lentisphaeria bacterium]|nr:alcohol dehydrogenase catalytic domain-containing protein [Lentisphaeria bacterium]
MKTMRLTAIREMAMDDIPPPEPPRNKDVLLSVRAVGVCGSDVHYYTTGRIGSQVVEFPFTVGHECAAVVEAVGAGVKTLKPGDRVAVDPAVSCHTACDQCLAGRPHTCRTLKFLGCPGQLDGCLSDYLVMPEASLFKIPDHMTLEEAALIEPLSIGIYAVNRSVPMAGATVGILGSGPIGLSVMLAARWKGAAAIYTTDRLDYRCHVASGQGAVWAGNPDTTDIVSAICEREPLLLDVVFECCGQQEALDQAARLVKPGGKVMLIGIPQFDRYTFPADIARRHEIHLQNVRRQNDCVQEAIDLVADGRIDPGFMVTHRFPFAKSKAAFDLVDQYADGVIKAMIDL